MSGETTSEVEYLRDRIKAAELAIVAARKVVSPFGSPDAVRVLAFRVNGYSDFIRFRPDRWQPQSDLA